MDPDGLDAYAQAFALMPLPALLMDDTRMAAANHAADQLLRSLEEPGAALRVLSRLTSRRRDQPAVIQVGSVFFRLTSTQLSTRPTLRLCLLFSCSRAYGSDPYGLWGLTLPERRVADGLERGLRNQEIAVQIGLSIETVRKHVAHILAKSGVRTRAAFVALVLNAVSVPRI